MAEPTRLPSTDDERQRFGRARFGKVVRPLIQYREHQHDCTAPPGTEDDLWWVWIRGVISVDARLREIMAVAAIEDPASG